MEEFQDRIDEYILGRMSDEEKAQFETEVNQDESKKEQLEFTRNVKSAIISREDKLAEIRRMQRRYDYEHRQVSTAMRPTGTDDCFCALVSQYAEKKPTQYAEKRHSRRTWWWASGIVAVLAIGLFIVNPLEPIFSLIDSSSNENIRDGNNVVFDVPPSVIKDSIDNDTIPRDTFN